MIVWVHTATDLLLAAVFASLAGALVYLAVRSRRLPFWWAYAAVGVFSAACASMHIAEVFTAWSPQAWASGSLKLIAALAAITTVALLVHALPKFTAVARARDLLQCDLESHQRDLEALACDVVERRHKLESYAQALRVARDDAERSSRSKSEFLRIVSHEIRTPIARIQLQLDRLRRIPDAPAAERGAVEKVQDAGLRLVAIVNAMLELAELQSARTSPHFESVGIDATIRSVVDALAPRAKARDLVIRFESAPNAPEAVTDPEILRRIFAHVLLNAIEHTSSGALVVAVEARTNGELALVVRETGRITASDVHESVFERFIAIDSDTRRDDRDVGIGLAIVRDAVGALGGRMELDFDATAGSAFRILLPTRAAAVAES